MRHLNQFSALLDLQVPSAVGLLARRRLVVRAFNPPDDAELAIAGIILSRGLSSIPALVPPPLEPFRSLPEASRSGDEILLLLINIIILS